MASGTIKAVASKADIDALNGKIDHVDTITITANTGYSIRSPETQAFKKCGIHYLTIYLAKTDNFTANTEYTNVATIPSGYVPSHNIVVPGIIVDYSTGKNVCACSIVLLTSGNIFIRTGNSVPTTGIVAFNAFY